MIVTLNIELVNNQVVILTFIITAIITERRKSIVRSYYI